MDQKVQEQQDAANKFLESGELRTATTYSYDCMVSVGGGFLNVDVKKGASKVAQFSGGFGGGGAYTGWGTAWCNKPVESMKGKSAGFTVEIIGILGGVAHVQIIA